MFEIILGSSFSNKRDSFSNKRAESLLSQPFLSVRINLWFHPKKKINLWKSCHVRLQNLIIEDDTFDRHCSFVI